MAPAAILIRAFARLLAVGTIFVTVFISIWSLRLRYAGREDASLRLDKWALIVVTVAYVAANAVLLYV